MSMNQSSEHEFTELRHLLACDNPSCGKMNASFRCSRCKCTYYCSVQCQRMHWKNPRQQQQQQRGRGGGSHKDACQSVHILRARECASWSLPESYDSNVGSTGNATGCGAACGICRTNTIRDPVVLPHCQHVFCFSCIGNYQGPVACSTVSRISGCPCCGAHAGRHVVLDAMDKADLYYKHVEYVLDDHDVDGRSEMLGLAKHEVDKVMNVDRDGIGLLALAKILVQTDSKEAIKLYQDQLAVVPPYSGLYKTDIMIALAIRSGNVEAAQEMMRTTHSLQQDKSGTQHLWPYQLGLARSYEAAGLCEMALAEYGKVNDCIDPLDGTEQTQVKRDSLMQARLGKSRCYFSLGDYHKALIMADSLAAYDRILPGAHFLIAKALLAMSENTKTKGSIVTSQTSNKVKTYYQATLEGAIEVMYKGFAYEEPWYDKNMRANRAFLQELHAKALAAAMQK